MADNTLHTLASIEAFQDFHNDCDTLIPQGDVVSQQDYVRVTLLDLTLDKAINVLAPKETLRSADVPRRYRFGLPISLIDRRMGAQTTRAQRIVHGGETLLVGLEGTILPGYAELPFAPTTTIWITESELDKPVRIGNDRRPLNERERTALTKAGVLRWDEEHTRIELRLQKPFSSISSRPENGPSPLLAFSQTSTAAFTPDERGFSIFMHLMKSNGNSVDSIIDGFRADPRAGEWFDQSLRPWTMWIPALPDNVFAYYLDRLKRNPKWPKPAPAHRFPSYPIALVNVFRQAHRLLGYSRGRLVESVTLGPEETVEVEVFTWDRTVAERGDEFSTEFESTTERQRNTSTNAQISSEMESAVGANVGGNLGVGLPIEAVQVEAGIDGSVSSELRSRNESTVDLLSEATSKASERFKATHQVKTLTRRESGTELRTTRKFRNPNLGRTMNLHHFEVLAHYTVQTTLDQRLRLGLLVENDAFGAIDRDWIRAHHHFLDEVLLHDVYREGLAAAQVLAAQEWLDELAAAEKKAAEEERQRLAEAEAANQTNTPGLPRKGIFDKATKLRDSFEKLLEYDFGDAVDVVTRFLDITTPVTTAEIEHADKVISRLAWWKQFNLAYPMMQDIAEQYVVDIAEAETMTDPTAQREAVISAVGNVVTVLDDDWMVMLKTFAASYVLFEMALPLALNPLVYAYMLKLFYFPNDMGLPKLLSKIRADYTQHEAKQSVETLAPPAAEAADLTPADKIPAPPRAFTQQELAEAHAAYGRLKAHLDANETYYRNEYYKREDPALRMGRLELLGVAPFVENTILGFAGTAAIYPLKLGAIPQEARQKLEQLRAGTQDDDPPYQRESTITLPAGGVTSEVVMGRCEALEPHLVELRKIDLRSATAQAELLEAAVVERRAGLAGESGSDVTDPVIASEPA